jgi:hypothetical protein
MEGAQSRSPVAVALFAALFILSGAAFIYLFSAYITDFLLAFMFTGFLSPIYARLLLKLGGKKAWIASSICCLLLVIVVALPLTFLAASISQEAANLYSFTVNTLTMEKIEGFLFGEGLLAKNAKRIAEMLSFDYTPESVKLAVSRVIGSVAQFLTGQVNVLLQNVFSVAFHFVIILLIVFYMLIDGGRLKKFIFRLSPLPDESLAASRRRRRAPGRQVQRRRSSNLGGQRRRQRDSRHLRSDRHGRGRHPLSNPLGHGDDHLRVSPLGRNLGRSPLGRNLGRHHPRRDLPGTDRAVSRRHHVLRLQHCPGAGGGKRGQDQAD